MRRKQSKDYISDEEIRKHINVPVELACKVLGWSSPTLYFALREQRVPFGMASRSPERGTWTYNISPAGLINYRNGQSQTVGLMDMRLILEDMAQNALNAMLGHLDERMDQKITTAICAAMEEKV